MSFDKKKIGAEIAALRKNKGLTQEQLAEKAGITVQYLGTLERGKSNTTLNRLDKIAKALECPSAALIFETGFPDSVYANISKGDPEVERFLVKSYELHREFSGKI